MLATASLVGCSKFDTLNALVPRGSAHRTLDIAYGDSPRQRLDVYTPRDVPPGAPVVVFFYGGDWYTGSKHDYRFVAQALTSRGFVVVLPDYRLHPEVVFPTFIEDGAAAARWTSDNISQHGGDPNRICLMGHSAGAYLAAMLTLDEHYLRSVGLGRDAICATAALSGPYDFVPTDIYRPVFGMSDQRPERPNAMSALPFVDAAAPPMLLIQGQRDKTVDPANTDRLEKKMREVGARLSVIRYPRRAHADVAVALAYPFRWLAPVLDDVQTFFDAAAKARMSK